MFMGVDGFKWFTGVVEDRKDPDKRGRVRVRIHALHSKEKQVNDSTGQGIPTEDLPWATVVRPITSAAMDGIGQTPLGLVEGSWVFGFARDGDAYNDLLILGSIGGRPEDPPNDRGGREGFVDPRTAGEIAASPRYINAEENRDPGYPPQQIPQGRYPQEKWLNEIDLNRLARVEKLNETYIKPKTDDLEKKIPDAFDSYWDEMEVPYAAQYPYNHVFETESGHVVEFDDTPHNERYHLWHKSGSYLEIHEDGKLQIKTQKDFFTIARGHINLYAEKDYNLTAKGDVGIRSNEGDVKVRVADGDFIVDAEKSINMIARGSNSFHMTAEDGPMIARTTVGPMVLDSMTELSVVSNIGSITQLAPLGSISGTALSGVNFTATAGNAALSSLGGDVSLSALSGSIVGLASSGMSWISNGGQMLLQALSGAMTIQNLGSNPLTDFLSINSETTLGLRTVAGTIGIETEEPLGTGIISEKPLELISTGLTGVVSIASQENNVEISASNGTIGMAALELSIEADTFNLLGEDIVIEGNNSLHLNSLVAEVAIDAAGDFTAYAGVAVDIEALTTARLAAGSDLNLFAVDSMDISAETMDLSSTSAMSLFSSTTIGVESTTSMTIDAGTSLDITTGSNLNMTATGDIDATGVNISINGTTVTVTSTGAISITRGNGSITFQTDDIISIDAGATGQVNLGRFNGPGDDRYIQTQGLLQDYFDTRYVQIP